MSGFSGPAQGQIPGTPTNDSASAGRVGQYVESVIVSGSAVSLTTATPATVTSISLTAGDWDVDSVGSFVPAATTSQSQIVVSISGTTNVLDTTPGKLGIITTPAFVSGGFQSQVSLPPYRLSLSVTTTVFMVAQSNFTVSTMTSYGIIRARRVR